MKTGILIAYYQKRNEAREAYRKLQSMRYYRSVLVSKSADDEVRQLDPFNLRRILHLFVVFILSGTITGSLVLVLRSGGPTPGWSSLTLIHGLAGGSLGLLLCAAWFRRSRFGVDSKLIKDHSRWLVSGESILILQGPIGTLSVPMAALSENNEIPPAVFVLHPKGNGLFGEDWDIVTPLDPLRMQEHALYLAAEHQVVKKPVRSTGLLKRLERSRRWIQQGCLSLTEASRMDQSLSPIAEWLLDNEYILESNARDVLLNLPPRFYRQLPLLANEPDRGVPRIYGLVRELVIHSDLRVDRENIMEFIESYQLAETLSIGELWAVPQMLRAVIIEGIRQLAGRALTELHERETANFWVNRLITANQRGPNRLFSMVADLIESQPDPSPYFATQLFDFLYDKGSALIPVQNWLERTFQKPMNDLMEREKNRQTKDQISIGNAFGSLRQLALVDWKECFEGLSRVERTLRQDPAGIYTGMDFATRDRYRRAVEDLHRGSGLSEDQVARRAVEMAARYVRYPDSDERSIHVGTYLVGDKRGELAQIIGCRETLRFRALRWVYCHHTAVYLLGIGLFSTAFISLCFLLLLPEEATWILFLVASFLLVPVSQLALEIMNYLVLRLLPPRTLPKMDFRVSGIPDACRTLVVVPMMLVGEDEIKAEAEKIEIRYLANKEANLFFALYSDYADSTQQQCEEDATLLQTAKACIETLNRRYGGERFFLLHRERKWSGSEQAFIGWERKRGKLEELNDLIVGTRPRNAGRLVYSGDPERLASVRFVITLDSDTQLPYGTARRMIETLAHPLNQPRFDSAGKVMAGSYTIIQPLVTPSLPSTSGSPFSRLFSDPVGIDPYNNAVSDVYQDLTGEASYQGKGIYDVRAFSRVLSGRFPESRILSHDLIEGAYVRVGLASDIELYDEFPQDYLSYVKRQHRWIRGDWQIAGWIFPRVPKAGGGSVPNPLSWFDRWKVFDNLRRSLLPASSMGLLLVSWLVSPQAGRIATVVVATQLFFHSLVQPFTWAITGKGIKGVSVARIGHDLLRVLAEAALLPYQAWLTLDAVARVFYRRYISHRHMLEWASNRVVHGRDQTRVPVFLLSMTLVSLFSIIAGWAVLRFRSTSFLLAGPWLMLWFLSVVVGWIITRRPRAVKPKNMLTEDDRRYLRNIARRTWRYFRDFVNEESSWLPPDNYQVSHKDQLAMRTSPTNIGLYLVSVLSAHDFGYLTVDEVALMLTKTMDTIGKLERHEGHLFNWYDILTLEPLKPHYVSTVDSGNLLGALWTLDQGLGSLVREPLFDREAFTGLRDTGEVLRQTVRGTKYFGMVKRELDELMNTWESPPENFLDVLHLLRRTERSVSEMVEEVSGVSSGLKGEAYWVGQIQDQHEAWLNIADRYLEWIEIMAEKTEKELTELIPEVIPSFLQVMRSVPSLKDLADGNVPCISSLLEIRKRSLKGKGEIGSKMMNWIDRVTEAFDRSKWLAGETLAAVEKISSSCRELSASINMSFLYNAERQLFSVGFNASEGRLDRAYYDLLASEVRLGSFVAIARGDIPPVHWFAMSRPYGSIGRRRVLLSWAGTMFEYLMPLLFQNSYGNSLLGKAAGEAVEIQIAYGKKNGTPWGISESAFGDLDHNKTYQYFAFGVPELGLNRASVQKLVVAPYATFLAIEIAPQKAVQNLRRLDALKLLSDYGYYEALDYSRQPNRDGEPGVVVRAYMAHHQGMSFLALDNLLHDGSLRRHFYSDPRVRTFEPLLQERIPDLPPLHHIATRERITSVSAIGEVEPAVRQFETPHTTTPKTQLLGNGQYGLMVTAAGGGYSRWGGIDITRWRSDPTSDPFGTFCYIHDVDSKQLWCSGYHPTGGKVEQYDVSFTLDRARFRRLDDDIESDTEIIVAPEDDVEIRRMTITNRSSRTRRLELTSYVELALAPHNADRQHPVFNKMFIQTDVLPEQHALLAWRRLRSSSEPPVFVAHRFTLEKASNGSADEALRFETDRGRFIGRNRTLADPMGARQEPGNSQGFVLDPILSLRRDLTLAPGQKVQVSLILVVGREREQVIALLNKYGDPNAIDRAMDFVWASALLELRLLRIQPDDTRLFQQLAGYLIYPDPFLRSSAERIAENHKGQAGLWTYGISGDLPVALVSISETQDLGLIRKMLQAHTYWRLHGLVVDLVILNDEAIGYLQPLREELEHLIRSNSASTGVDRPGGVYLLSTEMIPAEDLTLFQAVAGVVMVAAYGPLSKQLGALVRNEPDSSKPVARKRQPRNISTALPFMELLFFNSLGGFTPDGCEYAIYLGPGISTPAPWINVISNRTFGTMISETGAGFTWQGNSQRNRLNQWSNDPVMDPSAEAIYIRDEETGVFWTPTASPIREETAYRARHGAGYTVFEHNSHGIEQELTVFVPLNEQGGDPVKLQRLVLSNDTGRSRKLSLTYFVEWTLGEDRESSRMHIVTSWDNEVKAMIARNRYNPDYSDWVAFAAMSVLPASYTGDRKDFLGRNRSLGDPEGMGYTDLSRRTGAALDPCAALRVNIDLDPGERREITFMLGQASSPTRVHEIIVAYRDDLALEAALKQTRTWWDDLLGTIQISTPEPAVDLMINRWLLYQNLSCRIWGRSGFYQSGGAFGFRDQLQDVMALLYADPLLARDHILLAASRQFKEGDVQHWWHPPGGGGIRSRISDDLLWLPFVVAQYLRITADTGILNEIVPFLDSPVLNDDQSEMFQLPGVSLESATLFEHCRRALTQSRSFGVNGLPLMGGGDWNDGMNLVGAKGRGESVWLAWFMATVMREMEEMSVLMDQPELARSYNQDRQTLIENIEKFAWDGEWYLRATFDDGTPLGSAANTEARIDSLPQSWAWLSGAAADPARAEKALDSAWNHLVRKDEGLVLLFDPPFDRSGPSPGYIRGYPPGVRENGGQYTHAAIWLAMAFAHRGDGTRAAEILRMLNPIEHAREPESVWRYGIEPYAVAADVYRLSGRIGQGGWSWYTGSAAWMYRAWVEEILGLKLRGQTMQITPVIPGWWDGFQMSYRHGEALYEIQVENPEHFEHGVAWVEVDGQRVEDGVVHLGRDPVKHRIVVRMGK
ncbi:MAG TPA: glucoamylase family protein [Synergistales bacterium]|mgnify:CR=1 FL=1|nr:glucoamylase family protein [Synergistales bacterium]